MGDAVLQLFEDILCAGAINALPPLPRMIFVLHGAVTIADRNLADGEAWHGEGRVSVAAGLHGASLWRWELRNSAESVPERRTGIRSQEKLSAALATLPPGDLLLRGDSVGFPAGGSAYLHRHRGPGIRCLLEGGIRIDTGGTSTSYGPGGPWYESGPEPVFAQSATDRPSRFIRVMILPRELLGKSSIEFVNEDDRRKPRAQQYKIFADAPIARPVG
jgi:hypothetical protein